MLLYLKKAYLQLLNIIVLDFRQKADERGSASEEESDSGSSSSSEEETEQQQIKQETLSQVCLVYISVCLSESTL